MSGDGMNTVDWESLDFDGLDLNEGLGPWQVRELEIAPPGKRYEWSEGDADGSALVRAPKFENRQIKITLERKEPADTMDEALADLGALVDKLQECERHEHGLPLIWTPAGATYRGEARILSGQITGIPIDHQGGWLSSAPTVTVEMTGEPFLRGEEIAGPSIEFDTPLGVLEIPSVPGDVPALARLVITDKAGVARRHVEWGKTTGAPGESPAWLLDASDLDTTDTAGSSTTDADAWNTTAIQAVVAQGVPQTVCASPPLPDIGSFRVRARAKASDDGVLLRVASRTGDGVWRPRPWVAAPAGAYVDLDLGAVVFGRAIAGDQQATIRLDAEGPDSKTISIDHLVLIPTDAGYGVAHAPPASGAGRVLALDRFDAHTSGNLAGKTAPIGGTWAGAGESTDFVVDTSSGQVQRTTTVDSEWRLDTLGATDYDTATVAVTVTTQAFTEAGLVARYVDVNNWFALAVYAHWFVSGAAGFVYSWVSYALKRIGGSVTVMNPWYQFIASVPSRNVFELSLTADDGGGWSAQVRQQATGQSVTLSGVDPDLAAGGALATGKVGIMDRGDGELAGSPRSWDNFVVTAAPASDVVCHADGDLEIRHDDTVRTDQTGDLYGRPPVYRGARFLLDPAGDAGRSSYLAVKARRSDSQSLEPDLGMTDGVQAQVFYTPRFLAVPRVAPGGDS